MLILLAPLQALMMVGQGSATANQHVQFVLFRRLVVVLQLASAKAARRTSGNGRVSLPNGVPDY